MEKAKEQGHFSVSGIDVRYMPAEALKLDQEALKYVDTFALLPLVERLSHDPMSHGWDPPNLLATGPKGTGKSLLFAFWAQQNEIPYLALDCSEETKERHLKGGFVARSGETPFVLGTVANAIHVANEVGMAMLVLEEINALSPQMQKLLNPLLDFRKKIEIPELSHRLELRKGAKLFVVATMNPTVYGGTYELNEDLKSRFLELDIPYPPPAAEKRILREMAPLGLQITEEHLEKLVTIAQQTRQEATGYALSPRDLVQLLHVVHRVGWEDALFFAAQKFGLEDRHVVIDRIKDITRIAVFSSLTERAAAFAAQTQFAKG